MKKTKYPGIFVKYFEKFQMNCYMTSFRIKGKLYPTKNLTMLYEIDDLDDAFDKKRELIKAIKQGRNPFEEDDEPQHIERTINEHWVYELSKYQRNESKNTIKAYQGFYNRYIEPNIGNKKLSEIKTKDISDILTNTDLTNCSDSYRSLLRRLLRPIIAKGIADEEIKTSVVEVFEFDLNAKPKRKKISKKTKLSHIEIAKRLYRQIPQYISQYKNQRTEWQQLLWLQLLCGRRYGELFELTHENIDKEKKRINIYEDISKSNIETSFPIPEECQEFILSVNNGKVFKEISYGSYYMVFQRLKKKALEEKFDFELTAHDTRSLFMSILISLGEDSKKVDFLLDHEQNFKLTMDYYLDLTEESCNKVFEKYWKALRE